MAPPSSPATPSPLPSPTEMPSPLLSHVDLHAEKAIEELARVREMIETEGENAGLTSWLAALAYHLEAAKKHIEEAQLAP